ncbi:response regulator [Devosia oryziradicis]|uniref:histidine kinase n=1 Tax=Devosia oryziradicis TaxID=2801335 RepID=A0ABX7C0Q5_9HYPH|nr:ATP-binding protein [Devosia oryziradicis]QQR37337.1 response regulator [Devosia oryziradicis]
MAFLTFLQRVMNWFVPEHLSGDLHTRKRVQMFIISHVFGPIIATPIPVFLWFADPQPWPQVTILAASIYGFWPFLALVKLFPRAYTPLAMASVLNLTFCILWGTYNYGGTSSPFLVWLVLVPLLAFMYLGSTWTARIFVFGQIILGIAGLYGIYLYGNFPNHIPVENMVVAGVLSALGSNIYVFMMAAYYSSVVDSQSELIKEIDRHQATLKALTRAKDEAERANRAKSEFLAKMSHELRTPLNAVLGYSELMLEDAELEGRSEQIADLQKISAAGKHLLAMVNDILDISKIEAGKMVLHVENVDLDQLIDDVEATARPLVAKNSNSFAVERGHNLGTMRADITKLRQAIFNLLSNAAKFTHNGQITLSVKRDGDWMEIAVRDTGIGISPEQQKALFTNFSQANSKIAAVYGGTGLGLSLSQNLCRLMGGRIELESELGKGSRFIIRLPAQSEHDPAEPLASPLRLRPRQSTEVSIHAEDRPDTAEATLAEASPQPADPDQRARLLVVDDDRNFLELAERLFVREGYTPICTDAPQSALQIARTAKPTAIFLDILMPGFDGWDVLAALKADPITADIPVFMISILSERSKALAAGADGIVMKPFDGSKVKAALAGLKATRGRARAKAANG